MSNDNRLEASVFDVEAKQARQIIKNSKFPSTTIGGENGLTNSSTVYVTPSGKSYHKTKSCTTLKRSKVINAVTLSQAKAQGKSDPCNICVK